MIGHLCGPYCRKPSPEKVEVISVMKEECGSVMEVWRFLGACTFYHIWIPDHTHIVEPLYGLLKKGKKFEWAEEDMEVVHRLKKMLTTALALRKVVYKQDTPVYIMVDTSPTRIGWVVNQEDENDTCFPIRFGVKVQSERHQGCCRF